MKRVYSRGVPHKCFYMLCCVSLLFLLAVFWCKYGRDKKINQRITVIKFQDISVQLRHIMSGHSVLWLTVCALFVYVVYDV